ncbi:1-acyl-sn-glycerol-3-phosphate acyltransferase [Saprospiraceae bacterium]|nr:1-acyl-sn-glycerol-3-phosphate acyltransferase [Saprospiraceae bacterium]
MMSKIAKYLLKLWGFKITGTFPHHADKKVIIIAPHTSNWDFPLGMLVKAAEKSDVNFVAKKSLFVWPFGYFFRALGGVGVNRKKSQSFVDMNVELFNQRDKFTLQIAPEGTRKKVDNFKTSFYWIAYNAKVPLFLGKFDWKNKEVHFSDEYPLTGDIDKDMVGIYDYYRGTIGRVPEDSFLVN